MANDLLSSASAGGVSIEGLAELQAELQRLTLAASVDGGQAGAMNKALLQLQRYSLGVTHVITGRLKNSIFTATERSGGNDLIGYVATNVAYSIFEHRRPGEKPGQGGHDFFGRTVREEGPNINDLFMQVVEG